MNDSIETKAAELRREVAKCCEEHLVFIAGLATGDKVVLLREEVVALVATAIRGMRKIGGEGE